MILSVRQGINLYYGQLKVQKSLVQENLKICLPIKVDRCNLKKKFGNDIAGECNVPVAKIS